MRLDLVAERLSAIAGAPRYWYTKIDGRLYAQGINAVRPDPGA
jgi:hypothetical protein